MQFPPACAVLLALPLSTVALPAQVATVPFENRAVDLDSGYLDHAGAAPVVAFRKDVEVRGAAWLRLYFAATSLPAGSALRLTSAADGAVQRLDAASLRDYGDSSAYLNGDRVTVELLAGAGTRGNRVRVVSVDAGLRGVGGAESICGSTDDRILSSDPRVGRAVSGASACTWWLIDEFTILTAGHCASGTTSTAIVGFEIPLSRPDGTLVQPHPDDQYPLDRASLRFSNSGIGADWAVIAALRNSNHHQYPGQRQGAWFRLGAVPPGTAGVDIRITGNGRVSAPVSPTWNAVQKTHVGPRVSTTQANALAYATDTTGGNSGSPIIHEQSGDAIGIHTHGGCSSSGGQNFGTRIDRTDLAAAIATVRGSKVAGVLRTFGQGCGGAAGTPELSLLGVPELGGRVTAAVVGLPPMQAGAVLLGFSDVSWGGRALPLDLTPFGLAGCSLHIDIAASEARSTGSLGTAGYAMQIPAVAGLVGRSVFVQFVAADSGRVAVLSDAGEVRVGG